MHDPSFQHRKEVSKELDRCETGSWILIPDNADDYNIYFPPPHGALGENEQSEYLACCLPSGTENGRQLIVTTQNTKVAKNITSGATSIEVLALASVDAQRLLQS